MCAAGDSRASGRFGGNAAAEFGILGLTQAEAGRIGVYGDSNCLDSSHQRSPCFNMLLEMLKYAAEVRIWDFEQAVSYQDATPDLGSAALYVPGDAALRLRKP